MSSSWKQKNPFDLPQNSSRRGTAAADKTLKPKVPPLNMRHGTAAVGRSNAASPRQTLRDILQTPSKVAKIETTARSTLFSAAPLSSAQRTEKLFPDRDIISPLSWINSVNSKKNGLLDNPTGDPLGGHSQVYTNFLGNASHRRGSITGVPIPATVPPGVDLDLN
jgi:hypothetical protein